MNSIIVSKVSDSEVAKLLRIDEGHFSDLKAVEISPAKLTKSISGLKR